MKALMVMFDSLNRRMLPPYGCDWTHAPNFARLAERTVTFDNCYGGSMPCMPARREMHTGRHNFLHRSWGPLEPFDDSVPEMLHQAGVYTHLVTDHQHYWEDGGATYHQRYSTFEFFRGQEGDKWKGHVADPSAPEDLKALKHDLWRQDWINRGHLADEADHPQTLTFDAGIEFLRTNRDADGWFLQIETFDPHEPFFSYADHKAHYAHDYDGPHFDWPDYGKVTQAPEAVEHARREYAALLTMCDASLGRVLDVMDEQRMWDDTMLIVCTDHGFLLGEHGWWGKNVQPWYDETIHTPLFVWDPRTRATGRRDALVQTVDLGPTLLEFFGVDRTPDMQGAALRGAVADDTPVRDTALFGIFGGHVCVTDGRFVYMRAPHSPANSPLHEHTLMPTHMSSRFSPEELRGAELVEPFAFTKDVPLLRVPATTPINPYVFGSLLFDLATDPDQENPLVDDAVELRLATALRDALRDGDAPAGQFERLGLPPEGPLGGEHLLVREQRAHSRAALQPLPPASEFPASRLSVTTPLRDLAADEAAREVLARRAPVLLHGPVAAFAAPLPLLQLAAMAVGLLPLELLRGIADDLAALDAARSAAPARPQET